MKNFLVTAGSVLVLGAYAHAYAQETETPQQDDSSARTLQTVTVTAQKTEESLQSVPIAITAIAGNEMQDLGVANVDDLANFTPGVTIKSDFGAANPNIFIRGVGISDFNANVTGAVGVYIDEVYTSSPAAQLFQFFDADRVEVLRGPQGTLYGRNTTGGAFNFVSRKPTSDVSADFYARYGNFNALNIDAGIGGPIFSDQLNGRIAGTFTRRDGTTDNIFTGPSQTPDELNDQERWGLRGQLELTATPDLTFRVSAYAGSTDASALQAQHRGVLNPTTFALCTDAELATNTCIDALGYRDNDGDAFKSQYNAPSKEKIDLTGASLYIDYDIGEYTLNSITAYQDVDRYTIFDGDQGPTSILVPEHKPNSDQFSQELRLSSPTNSRFRWIAGAFYFEEDLHFDGRFDVLRDARPGIIAAAAGLTPDQLALSPGGFVNGYNPLGSATLAGLLGNPIFAYPSQILEYKYDQNVETWAVYGQTYFDITDTLTATLGLRYSEEERQFDYLSETVEGAIRIPLAVNSAALGNNETSFDDLSYRAALEWDMTDDAFAYASVSQASKSGGFNGSVLFFPVLGSRCTKAYCKRMFLLLYFRICGTSLLLPPERNIT